MAEKSSIQWTQATWNPWTGCEKVSAGCKYCYMFRDKERFGQEPTKVVLSSDRTFFAPTRWKDRKTIFTCSWSDFMIKQADPWREKAWNVIRGTPQHIYQILTKRPERFTLHYNGLPSDWGEGWDHVWLGVSVEDFKTSHRLLHLVNTPAKTRFISVEPMLEKINFMFEMKLLGENIHWVIVGGESGFGNEPEDSKVKYGYRECKVEWIEDVIRQCRVAGIPVFVKQLGSHLAREMGLRDSHGGDINEWPERLRVREFPR